MVYTTLGSSLPAFSKSLFTTDSELRENSPDFRDEKSYDRKVCTRSPD